MLWLRFIEGCSRSDAPQADVLRGEIALEHKEHQGHKGPEGIPTGVEALSGIIIDAGLKVHRTLGPGLLESAYESCLYHELQLRGTDRAPSGATARHLRRHGPGRGLPHRPDRRGVH